jgi:acyl carrier protein
VKVRGHRIELGEIEAGLRSHEQVKDCVVVVREEEPGNKQLVGYVVAEQAAERSVGPLRRHLESKLPDYMVPSAFVFLEKLPLTPNGKVDRRALPTPDRTRRDSSESYVAPRTPIEETVVKIVAEVLGLKEVGVHDDFFQLGGHSLLATQIVSRLRSAFQLEVPIRSFFETPTVAGLTEVIDRLQKESSAAPARRVERIEPAIETAGRAALNQFEEEFDAVLDPILTGKNLNL